MPKAVRNVEKIKYSKKDKISIVIPAAGIGYRMNSYGPKPLLKLKDNKRIIDNQLNVINECFTNKEVVLVGGYHSEKLFNNTPDNLIKVMNERYKETNVAHSIRLGIMAATTSRILIIYGDLFFCSHSIDFMYTNKSFIITSNEMGKEEVGTNIANKKIISMFYDIHPKWGQILYCTGKELALLKKHLSDANNEKCFGFELINKVVEDGGKIFQENTKYPIYDIDTIKDLKHVREKYANYI